MSRPPRAWATVTAPTIVAAYRCLPLPLEAGAMLARPLARRALLIFFPFLVLFLVRKPAWWGEERRLVSPRRAPGPQAAAGSLRLPGDPRGGFSASPILIGHKDAGYDPAPSSTPELVPLGAPLGPAVPSPPHLPLLSALRPLPDQPPTPTYGTIARFPREG